MRSFHRFATETGGAIAVEFIVMLPLILAALVFVYELGRIVWMYEMVSQDMRTAMRYLSRASADPYDCAAPTPVYPRPQAAFVLNARNLALTGQSATGGPLHMPWTGAGNLPDPTYTDFTAAQYNQCGTVITWTATVPVNLSFLAFIGVNPNFTISMTENGQYMGD